MCLFSCQCPKLTETLTALGLVRKAYCLGLATAQLGGPKHKATCARGTGVQGLGGGLSVGGSKGRGSGVGGGHDYDTYMTPQ